MTRYRVSDFNRLTLFAARPPRSATVATNTFTTGTAHGLIVGDIVALSGITGLTGVNNTTQYFVVSAPSATTLTISATQGGSAIGGSGSATVIGAAVIDMYKPQSAEHEFEVDTLEWRGGGTVDTQTIEKSMTVTIAQDALDNAALARIFNETVVTTGLPAGIALGVYGSTAAQAAGASVSLRLRANAYKVADNGAESIVLLERYFPRGTFSRTNPGGLSSNEVMPTPEWSFSAQRVTTDILGLALPNIPSGGARFRDDELV